MKKILILLLITFNAFGQEINYRRVTNSTIIESDTIVSSHSSDTEAQQQLLNLKLQGRSVKMHGATYEVDIVDLDCKTDTIFIGDDWSGLTNMKVIDTIRNIFWNYGNIRGIRNGVISSKSGTIVIEKDSVLNVPHYSFSAVIERTKSWPDATTKYKLVDTPFYFHKSDSIVSVDGANGILRFRTFASKKHCIRQIVNNEVRIGNSPHETMSCNPGQSTHMGGSFRHTNTIIDLDFTQTNLIRFEAVEESTGKIIGSTTVVVPIMQ